MAHKPLSKSELKEFRRGLSILKKKGIVQNIDVRKAEPWMIRQGKRLGDQVKKFDDVISGKAEAVALPKEKVKAYRKAGYETTQGRVMVPKLATDKVSIEKGEIKITDKKSRLEIIKKAVPYDGLGKWLEGMKANHLRIDAMKRRNEFFAYKIGDNHSWRVYRTIEQMIDDFENGSVSGLNLSDKIRHDSYKQQNEFFEELNIVRVPRSEAWPGITERHERQRGGPQSKKARKKWLKRIKGTDKYEQMKLKDAARKREYRAKLKGKALEEYKRDGRKRAKKSAKRRNK